MDMVQDKHPTSSGKEMPMLQEKKYFLFDIDGTLAVDETLYPGSRKLLDHIDRIGGKSFFITNNSIKSRKDYVAKFARWGISASVDQFMTASYVTCRYLKDHYNGKKLFVLGTPSLVEEVKSYDLAVTEQVEPDVSCVVAGFDNTLTYGKVDAACELLFRPDVDFVATNPDLRCPTSYGFMPDCGSICRMLTGATDREPYFVGKPGREMVDLCRRQVDADPAEMLVVGDRLYTDIACGINAGVETALVFTGEARPEDLLTTPYPPDYTFDTIGDLYQAIMEGEDT